MPFLSAYQCDVEALNVLMVIKKQDNTVFKFFHISSAAFLVACHVCTYINKIIIYYMQLSCWQIKYD